MRTIEIRDGGMDNSNKRTNDDSSKAKAEEREIEKCKTGLRERKSSEENKRKYEIRIYLRVLPSHSLLFFIPFRIRSTALHRIVRDPRFFLFHFI